MHTQHELRRRAPIRRALAAVLAAAFLVALVVTPAGAHSALIGASPGPDDTVGGTITVIELKFNEPVSNANITVSYNEEPLPGTTTVPDGAVIRFDLAEPLAQPGRYEIAFDLISFDTDHTTNAFFFTFDPAAPAPGGVGQGLGAADGRALLPDPDDGGSGGLASIVLWTAVILVPILVGLFAFSVWRSNNQRRIDTTV